MARLRTISIIASAIILYAATVSLNSVFKNQKILSGKETDIIQNMFGGLRGAVSDWALMKSEEYYHRGLDFLKAEGYHEGEMAIAGERARAEGAHRHESGHAAIAENKNLFEKLYSAVKITGDRHLNPSEEKEVLPWFYVEVMFNPKDIRGYVLGSYWLGRLNRPEDSLKFLKEGERNNPDSARILAAIGEFYFHSKKYDEAIPYLERARILWLEAKAPNNAEDKYSQFDRAIAFDVLGSLFEERREYRKALDIYLELAKFYPYPITLEKIKRLHNLLEGGK